MEITLIIDGNEKTFVTTFVSSRMLRKTIEIARDVDFSNLNVKILDELVDYIVELFGNKFTRDGVYDGLESRKLLTTITDCMNTVMGDMDSKLETLAEKNL